MNNIELIIFYAICIILILIRLSSDRYRSNPWDDSWRVQRKTDYVSNANRNENRKLALKKVQRFLKPYTDRMGNLCISNDNCKVDIVVEKNGEKKIICTSKIPEINNKKLLLTAAADNQYARYYLLPYDYVIDNLWDSICMNFDETTVYKNVVSALSTEMLDIKEIELDFTGNDKSLNKNSVSQENLLDINSASERELLSLPGINVVTAKKAIKYIQKNKGFKTFEEFVQKMRIKENFVEQIKAVTCIKPVNSNIEEINEESTQLIENNDEIIKPEENSSIQNPTNDERIIDL